MPDILFRYKAKCNNTNTIVTGEQRSIDVQSARQALWKSGLHVLSIKQVKNWDSFFFAHTSLFNSFRHTWDKQQRQRRINIRIDLYDGLATMLDSGLTLEQTLNDLSLAPTRTKPERQMLLSLRNAIREGQHIGQACRAHNNWFSPFDIALLEAGQHAGDLTGSLQALALHLQHNNDIKHKLMMALAYPSILIVAAIGVVLFLSTSTLPELAAILEDNGQTLPTLTAVVMKTGNILISYFPLLFLGSISIWIILTRWIRSIQPHSKLGNYISSTIIIRALRRSRIAELSRTLSRLLDSGIPLADAIAIAGKTAPGPHLKKVMTNAQTSLTQGHDFSQIIAESSLFDPEFSRLLLLGEQSGELPALLRKISKRFHRSSQQSIDTLTTLLEPFAIFIMAALIGIIAMAAVLPLARMGEAM